MRLALKNASQLKIALIDARSQVTYVMTSFAETISSINIHRLEGFRRTYSSQQRSRR